MQRIVDNKKKLRSHERIYCQEPKGSKVSELSRHIGTEKVWLSVSTDID